MMVLALGCPCGQARPYSECCGALHRGERKAETAEALMRSRYAAFSRGEVDYLIRTWHPDKQGEQDKRSLEATCRELRWAELEILDVVNGAPTDDTGIVEFEARYATGTSSGVLRERSNFQRIEGAWYYVDGVTSDREGPKARAQGRNEPCACGSGKKFKRCCGG
jgi:SEC-C motif-containing protein